MSNEDQKSVSRFNDSDMQSIIGWILRIGVTVSMVVVLIGGSIYLYRHSLSDPGYREFEKVPYFISTTDGILEGVIHGKGQAIIQLGIMILIATPILRIIFAIVAFALEKDRLYMLISMIVLLIIFVSMLTGRIG